MALIRLCFFFALLYGSLSYQITRQVGSEPLGCWSEGTNSAPRVLHYVAGSSATTTVDSCLSTCTGLRFALAGVEYGDECYCGNAILYNYGSSTDCTKPCVGDAAQTCGGRGAINIYTTGVRPYTVGPATVLQSYGAWRYGYCWKDYVYQGDHILPHRPSLSIPAEEMTVERCLDGCGASGYTSAGPEYGQECWCGNVTSWPPGESTVDGECDKPCLNDASHYCGGSQRIIIYSTELPW